MKKTGAFKMLHLACALLFCAFTFVYLYFYQADVMTVVQHNLSGGSTHYDRTIGAILLTIVLYLIHLAVYALTRLNKRMHALTYFPSLLFLTVLTDTPLMCESGLLFGYWTWIAPLLLLLYMAVVYMSKKVQPYEVEVNSKGIFSQLMWINIFTMVLMFVFVGLFSNGNDVFHYKAKIETCIEKEDFQGALAVGKKSLATDSSLTMLRAYALAREGILAEKLFEYPLVGGSQALLPDGKHVKPLMLSAPRISRYAKKRKVSSDYKLMGLLLDKKLDEFVVAYKKYKQTNDTVASDLQVKPVVPKHYREALVLYGKEHKGGDVDFRDSAMEADYDDFLALKRKYGKEYPAKIKDVYATTYWWYYFGE